MNRAKIINADVLSGLRQVPDESVHTVCTSPPYWGLRNYGVEGQLGLEKTPEEYIAKMVLVFREVRRVLRKDGTLWLNMGDGYAGSGKGPSKSLNKNNGRSTGVSKPFTGDGGFHRAALQQGALGNAWVSAPKGFKQKDLMGIPWMLAFALRADGWYLRQDIIWHKPNPMPESVNDRCTKAHEYIFLLSKSRRYYFDAEAIKEPASYNTHARVARAAVDHKSMPDEKRNGIRPRSKAASEFPGEANRDENSRRPGVNPKARHPVAGWAKGPGDHSAIGFNQGDKRARSKQNESFSSSVVDLVDSRNKRSVWSITTEAFPESHFATFPQALVRPCILAGCPTGGVVLDPFTGSGTTGMVALQLGRNFVGTELNPEYARMAEHRIREDAPLLNRVEVVE